MRGNSKRCGYHSNAELQLSVILSLFLSHSLSLYMGYLCMYRYMHTCARTIWGVDGSRDTKVHCETLGLLLGSSPNSALLATASTLPEVILPTPICKDGHLPPERGLWIPLSFGRVRSECREAFDRTDISPSTVQSTSGLPSW